MKYVELKQHLLSGKPLPAYTLYGDDRYLLTYAKKLFRDRVAVPELNMQTFSASARAEDVVAACRVYPMMADFRLVYWYGFSKADPALLAYLDDPAPDTVLLLEPEDAPAKDLLKKTEGIDCAHLDEALLKAWIARASKKRFSDAAATLLIAYTLGDLGRIETEVQKLCGYCAGAIGEDAVREHVTRDAEFKLYEMTQELFEGSPDKAYDMLAALLREEKPLALFRTIYTQAHNMLFSLVSKDDDATLAASFRVKPFAIRYTRARARLYGPVRLRSLCDYLTDCEYRIKTGRLEQETALYNVFGKIVSMRSRDRSA